MGGQVLTDQALDVIFRAARTANAWLDKPVSDDLLKKIYEDMKYGPTAANSSPLRLVFVKTPEAKARLKPAMQEANLAKTMAAPVNVIFAYDTKFYDQLPKLFPHMDARSWFVDDEKMSAETAFRSSSLQAAYFIIAARAHGLDCGPMSGFDNDVLDKEFFADGQYKSNFICNLGYADSSRTFPRLPRLSFDEACKIL